MLQKKLDNIAISKMRTIRILEADLDQILKWASREMIKEIKRRPDGLSDMQFGFRKHHTTHQAILSMTSMIDIAHQARIGFATADADCRAAFKCVIPEVIRLAITAKGTRIIWCGLYTPILHRRNFRCAQEALHHKNDMEEEIEISVAVSEAEHQDLTGY